MTNLDPAIQLNFRIGDLLANLYASDEIELDILLGVLEERTARIASINAELRAASAAAGVLGPLQDVPQQASRAPRETQALAQMSNTPPAPSCEHGQRVWVTGQTKQGIPYEAWDCPGKGSSYSCPRGKDRVFHSYNGKVNNR